MRYKLFEKSDLRVSELCLGTITFGENWGWGASKEGRKQLISHLIRQYLRHFSNSLAGGGNAPSKHIVFRVRSLKTSVLSGKVVRFLWFSAKNHVFQQNSNFGEGIDKNAMKKNIGIISLFIGVIFFMACKENKSTVTTDHEMLSTPGMSFEGDFHTTLPSGLSIDAYELQDAPNIEPVTFDPVSDYSQRELLSIHENERKLKFSNNTLFASMGFSMKAQCDNFTLLARHKAIPNENSIPGSTNTMFIEVLLDVKVIYTADTGDASPIVPLQGLWCYDRNWVLEYADITLTLDDETNSVRYDAVGHLVENGILINEQNSFDEIFGFQLLRGKPFYFFDKNGLIGVSFDEQATVLGYEEIPHFGCCSASLLNPDQAQNMVTFFARKDGIWYYVEIGVYE